MYTEEQINKIGNTIVYLSTKITAISKTKLLNLIYLLDEVSIKRSGLPFLNLRYKVWKMGPVADDIFIELSSVHSFLNGFLIRKTSADDYCSILPEKAFEEDEFSQNEIELLNYIIEKYGNASPEELILLTQHINSPWYKAAKNNSALELVENKNISSTDIIIDLGELVEHNPLKKSIFEDYLKYA